MLTRQEHSWIVLLELAEIARPAFSADLAAERTGGGNWQTMEMLLMHEA